MTISELSTSFEYHYWANSKLLDVVSTLSEAQFTQDVAGSLGSVRNTLVHVLSTEWGWLARCGGHPRGSRLDADEFPTPRSLVDQWVIVRSHVEDFLQQLSDDDLHRIVEYPGSGGTLRQMPIGELMHHSVNHAVHHRAQVVLMLRELGVAPGNFDLLFFYAERRGVSAW